jgi:hypothetical protein
LEVGVLRDLAVLTPPALVFLAFLVALFVFLRREMRSPKKPADEEQEAERPGIDNPPDRPDDAASR